MLLFNYLQMENAWVPNEQPQATGLCYKKKRSFLIVGIAKSCVQDSTYPALVSILLSIRHMKMSESFGRIS